jgi:hypothetical protein
VLKIPDASAVAIAMLGTAGVIGPHWVLRSKKHWETVWRVCPWPATAFRVVQSGGDRRPGASHLSAGIALDWR